MNEHLQHWGVIGQRWGIRRYQNEDGSYTPEGRIHREELDQKWVKKNYDKIYKKAYEPFRKELQRNKITEITEKNERKVPKRYLYLYNQEMAKFMNQSVGNLSAPSGQVVRFIWSGGRIAYKKKNVDRMNI